MEKLRNCKECAFSNRECTYCSEIGKHILPYQYACPKFRTDEEEMVRLREKAERLAERRERKLNFLLTTLMSCATAGQMLLEDFDGRFLDKTAESEWRHSHKKALGQICRNIDGCRKLYDQYFQKDIDKIFSKGGSYDVTSYDNHNRDAQEICRLLLLYVDRCFDSFENSSRVFDFIESLPTGDIFEKEDINHYRMKEC